LAGGISGAFTWAIIYPFDVIKSRIQTSPLERNLQKGMWTVGSDLVKKHGWQYMFRGLGVTLVRAFPVNAIIFPVYEFTLMQLAESESQPYVQNTLKVFTCGSIAGTVQAFVICPMEHIKCRLQVAASTQHIYKGPVDAGVSIVKQYGLFRGLYRGMGVTLWRETPAFGMYFATYDSIKARVETLLEDKDEHHPIPSHAHAWAASALAGGISGALTWAIIYPFDVIKSRMQTGPLERHLQKGMWTVAKDIVVQQGWKYMFRGLGVTLVRAFPVNAIIFPVYEFTLMQLGDGD
ncbi:predicted protein, partial [Thalassiosira pseudonana CCMP1335]